MPLQKLPVTSLDDLNHRRRSREVLNKVLDHSFDDSRVQTTAETLAGVTPVNAAYEPGDVRRYGAILDNSTDAYAAVLAAAQVAAISGGEIFVAGQIAIDSAKLSTTAIALGSSTVVRGLGRDVSKITVTGTTACVIFAVTNKSGFHLVDIHLYGNSQGTGTNDGQFLAVLLDTSATGNMSGFLIERCRFTNFKGDYWCRFLNSGNTTYCIQQIWIRNNEFIALSGNSRDKTSIGAGAYCVAFQGSSTVNTALVQDAWVEDNFGDCDQIKGFGVAWQGSKRIRFARNNVLNAGQTGADDHTAGYALFTYDNSLGGGGAIPDQIWFIDNILTSPRSCGVYVAGCNRVYAFGNKVNGQSDTTDGSLPKGAIVCNGATYFEANDNWINDCYGGVVLYGNSTTDVGVARRNTIQAGRANGFGIRLRTTFSGKSKYLEASANYVECTGSSSIAIYCQFTDVNGVSNLVVKDNPFVQGTSYCLLQSSASAPIIDYADISNNFFVGNGSTAAIFWNNVAHANTRAVFRGNTVAGSFVAAGVMALFTGARGLTIYGLTLEDATSITTGFAIQTDDARGNMEGVRFTNIAAARRVYAAGGTEELGLDTPTWTGVAGDFIQNLVPADTTQVSGAVVGALNTVIMGWHWTTAWRPAHVIRA